MKKITPVSFSFFISLIVAFIFLLITFWIFYQYSWSAAAAKDALSTTGSYFGAVTTLVAAIIAAYLYTDWKEPHLFLKIAAEQKEIISLTRRMKRNIDAFTLFMETKKPLPTGLNNGDIFSHKYQILVNTILDDIDDLAGLLKTYQFNFKENIPDEKNHLDKLMISKKNLSNLYVVFSEPNPVTGYMESYHKLKNIYNSNDLRNSYKEILLNLPDNLSEYHSNLTRK